MVFGGLQQYLLDEIGLQWTLCTEALILSTGIICGLLLSTGPGSDIAQEKHDTSLGNRDDGLCRLLAMNTFDCELFRKPPYMLFCIALILFAFGSYVPAIYLPDFAISHEIKEQEAANLISVIGLANLASRLVFGFIGDFGPLIRFYLCGLSIICLGVISVALPFFTTYYTFLVYASLFGICVGCFISLLSVVLVDLLGLENIEKSVGQAMTINSPVYLIGSPLSALAVEVTGQAAIPFYLPGTLCTLGGCIFLSIQCVHKFNQHGYEGLS